MDDERSTVGRESTAPQGEYIAGRRVPPATWEAVARIVLLVPGGIFLVIMVGHVTANALSRTLFGKPLAATLEITQFWYMPVIVGIAYLAAQLARQHVDADLFFGWFSDAGRKWLMVGVNFLGAAIMAIWGYFSLLEGMHALRIGALAGITQIPAWPPYFVLPIAFFGMALLFLITTLRSARSPKDSFDESEEEVLAGQIMEDSA